MLFYLFFFSIYILGLKFQLIYLIFKILILKYFN